MKRYLGLIIPLSIILCGCFKNTTLNIKSKDITNISYEDKIIPSSDFDKLIDEINGKKFYDLQDINVEGKKLTIDTAYESYDLEVFDNFLVYNIDGKKYYTKIDSISNHINELTDETNIIKTSTTD